MRPIQDALAKVRRVTGEVPRVAVLLAPGMEALAQRVTVEASLTYGEMLGGSGPKPVPAGRLLIGRWLDVSVAVVQGVSPRSDGAPGWAAMIPLRVTRLLAGTTPPPLLIAGACTSLHPLSEPGELALLDDHINLLGENPLVGPNLDALGPRFPDMNQAYDERLRDAAVQAAREGGIPLRRGVYVAVAGPQRPTRAEYRMFRWIGGDFVGSGIAPEVIVARHMEMRVLALLAVGAVHAPEGKTSPDASGESLVLERAGERAADTLEVVLGRLAAASNPVA